MTNNVWLITGASGGLGLTLTQTLLREGYRVAATSRKRDALIELMGDASADFLPLAMDVTDESSVAAGIEAAVAHFSRLDVVVNNAGYGQIGALEELTDREVRREFDVNVFGLMNVIRRAMPVFRKQRSGLFYNISSIGGYSGRFAGWGAYCASKFAVAGLTEALRAEAAAFGVKAVVVYPGYFRTGFLSKSSVATAENPIAAYIDAHASRDLHTNEIDGNQPGDPEKLAGVLIRVSKEENPALHLFIGQDAYDEAREKARIVEKDLARNEVYAVATAI